MARKIFDLDIMEVTRNVPMGTMREIATYLTDPKDEQTRWHCYVLLDNGGYTLLFQAPNGCRFTSSIPELFCQVCMALTDEINRGTS